MPTRFLSYNMADFLLAALVLAPLLLADNISAQETRVEEEVLLGPESEIVAVVNDENLTRQQLSDLLIESFGDQGLDVLVRRTVIYQQADKLGITVSPEEVNERLNELLEREIGALIKARGLENEKQLQKELSQMGADLDEMKETMSARLRKGMEVELLAEKVVGTTVTVTEEDLEAAYEDRYGAKIDAVQVVVNTRQEAEGMKEKIASGADFETLARNESIDRLSAAAGGRMRPFGPNEGVFGPKVAHLEEGQVSDIIKTENGYHILKIQSRTEKSSKDFEETKSELEETVRRRKIRKRLKPWLSSTIERAEVKKYLITY